MTHPWFALPSHQMPPLNDAWCLLLAGMSLLWSSDLTLCGPSLYRIFTRTIRGQFCTPYCWCKWWIIIYLYLLCLAMMIDCEQDCCIVVVGKSQESARSMKKYCYFLYNISVQNPHVLVHHSLHSLTFQNKCWIRWYAISNFMTQVRLIVEIDNHCDLIET